MWLHWRACYWFLHISSILSGSCDLLECMTKEWILIMRTRQSILTNTKRPFWSTWRINTMLNIEMCQSIYTKAYRGAIISLPKWFSDPVNHPLIHIICPAMMKKTQCQTMWLRQQQHEAIVQHAYWPPPALFWIRHLKHQGTGGKLIQISMITTPTQWRLAVHFGYRTSPTGGVNRKKRTPCTSISLMWPATYSLSYQMVSEWRSVFL